MAHRPTRVGATALVAAAVLAAPLAAQAQDDVDVRFSWKMKGEYAPFFLAEAMGAFDEHGLDVTLAEGAGSQAALGALIQGREDVVIMPGIFALSGIQQGMPVKMVALWHPRTPVVMITHPENPATEPADLEGMTVATAVGETGTTYLPQFCAINGINCDAIDTVLVDSQARVPQFLQGQVDAVSVYRSNDLPIIEAETGVDYPILDLGEFGLAAPGMSAVTSEALLEERPDVIARFIEAANAGIAAAKADPQRAAEAILDAWPEGPSLEIVTAQVEATVDAVPEREGEPLGYIRAEDIAGALALLETEEEFGEPMAPEAYFSNQLFGM